MMPSSELFKDRQAITQSVINLWFEGKTAKNRYQKKQTPYSKWFAKSKRFDDQLREQFSDIVAGMPKENMLYWQDDRLMWLAAIILMDQFSRNIFRNTPQMFASDGLALSMTLGAIEKKQDRLLDPLHRIFLYMPLMHAEDVTYQQLSVSCFKSLYEEAKEKHPENVALYHLNVEYALRHQEVVDRFGRFPHRNKILGRSSTETERQFLEQPRSSF